MGKRFESLIGVMSQPGVRPMAAIRECFHEGYGARDFRADLMSGMVVGIVALPLAMALAIASGVPPQHGLYTAVIAGGLAALMGGSRVQVSGPTAAFVVILAPISAKYGLAGLATASVMAGFMLLLLGYFRMGRLISFVPYPVTTGFTAGIAVVIATLQLKDFLGLSIDHMPEHYAEKVLAIARAMTAGVHWPDLAVGLGTLLALIVLPRITKRIPAPLIALTLAALAAWLLSRFFPAFDIATIHSRFTYLTASGEIARGIPSLPPTPGLPWHLPGPDGEALALNWEVMKSLLASAFAIAMLGAIESLLSATVADGMTGKRHDPDAELVAQGMGNLAAPFFGGFAATGAIARTATNVRSGGRSPIAAIVHALFILAAVLALAPLLGYLPMAALAALLLIVAKNMSEARHFLFVLRVGPKSDGFVLIVCFLLTVMFDMVIAVGVGVVLASILFMRRMAEIAEVELLDREHPDLREPLPEGVMLYRIAGPLFFGAAQKAMSSLDEIAANVRLVILDLEDVPVIDATGLVNLESTIKRLHANSIEVIVAGAKPQPRRVIHKAKLGERTGTLRFAPTRHEAVETARERLAPPSSGE